MITFLPFFDKKKNLCTIYQIYNLRCNHYKMIKFGGSFSCLGVEVCRVGWVVARSDLSLNQMGKKNLSQVARLNL